ncbi:MAG: cell division ATP-binding protein FtsE [Bacteriovoracia bacterium]
MIRLTGVTKAYSSSSVLTNVSFAINKGEFVYVVGDSGAGKTTLLKMLYGEEAPSRGVVEVMGQDIAKAGAGLLQQIRRRIGIIFQDLRLVDELSVYDNIAFSLEISGQDQRKVSQKKMIEDTIQLLSLGKIAKKKVHLLSGGERQRVAAARAVVRQPEMVIADEPTGSLDREQSWNLMDLFQKLHMRGTTIVIATHDREIVRRVRRRSCILQSGRLVMEDGICIF